MPRQNNGPYLKRDPKTGLLRIHWTDQGRSRRKSTGTPRRSLAEEKLEEFLRARRYSRDTTRRWTGQEVWDLYWAEHVERKVTDKKRLELCWNNLAEHFANRALADLTQDDFNKYTADRLFMGRAINTVRKEIASFLAAINWAIKTRRVSSDSTPYVELPPIEQTNPRWLRAEEIDALQAAATSLRQQNLSQRYDPNRLSRAERYIAIGVETGARRRSIEKLTWDRVDFDRRLINLDHGGPQTKKRRPVVPMSDNLAVLLRRAHSERKGEYVLDHRGSSLKTFQTTVNAAGLGKDVTPKCLRHTFATHAVMNGVSLEDVARVLGNTPEMVRKVYAQYQPEYLHHAVNFRPVKLKDVGLRKVK